jgi:hypothetical protein
LRESRSFAAHGSNGSSPGFSPPSRSMSAIVPPPTHGPVRSTLPSASRGTGRLLASAPVITGLPGLMNDTPPSTVWPLGFRSGNCPAAARLRVPRMNDAHRSCFMAPGL